MDSIDEILGQVGITTHTVPHTPAPPPASVASEVVEEEPPTPADVLSDDDFMDILRENGLEDAPEGNLEEEEQEEPEEWDVSMGENREYEVTVGTTQDAPFEEEPELDEQPTEEERTDSSGESPRITPNSPTLLIDNSTSRFSGASWYGAIQNSRIILAGLGGIGSWCALQLSRMAPEVLFLYDDDIVETVNMAGQCYQVQDIGVRKANAVLHTLTQFNSSARVHAIPEKFKEDTPPGDIMICGFDNMVARRIFFNSWQSHVFSLPKEERKNCLFIDGRLSMSVFQVLCLQGDDEFNMERYREEFLFYDDEAEETVCSRKQTTYLACMIGSYMVNMFTNFIANSLDPLIPFALPFFTEYDAEHGIFKTEN